MTMTTAGTTIDLNSDLGEGFGAWRMGDDDALLGIVTSANVACGFHAGDSATMRHVCKVAANRGVAVGAHVSYRDLAGFGRRPMDVPAAELAGEVLYQLGALDAFCRVAGTRIRYVKPHGALYNTAVHDETQAAAVAAAVADFGGDLAVLGLPGSALLAHAEKLGLRPVREAFADRAYNPDGTLLSRRSQGAVIHDPDLVARRAVRMAVDGSVVAVDGTVVPVAAESLCLHGDTAGAVQLAGRIRAALEAAGVGIRAFTTAA